MGHGSTSGRSDSVNMCCLRVFGSPLNPNPETRNPEPTCYIIRLRSYARLTVVTVVFQVPLLPSPIESSASAQHPGMSTCNLACKGLCVIYSPGGGSDKVLSLLVPMNREVVLGSSRPRTTAVVHA